MNDEEDLINEEDEYFNAGRDPQKQNNEQVSKKN